MERTLPTLVLAVKCPQTQNESLTNTKINCILVQRDPGSLFFPNLSRVSNKTSKNQVVKKNNNQKSLFYCKLS